MPVTRLRFELFFLLAGLIFGALLLPALIYAVGVMVLGSYEGGDLATFYASLYRDLFDGSGRAAGLIFGPLLVAELLRLPFMGGHRSRHSQPEADHQRSGRSRRVRIEPRIDNSRLER